MRINLATPFAEKDAAKALGARWDSDKRLWYITDVADLKPFLRWIPDLAAATESASAGSTMAARTAPKAAPQRTRAGAITKPAVEVPHCGCKVLPWEDCEHSVQAMHIMVERNRLSHAPLEA